MRSAESDPARVAACVLLLATPWLWPYTTGPTPNVLPLLVAWACVLVAWMVAATGRDPVAAVKAAIPRAWLAAALVSAVIGLLQWLQLAPDTVLVNAARAGEAYGNLRQRNQFASLTSVGLAVLLCAPGRIPRGLLVAATLLLATANAASASRTGLLEWAALTVAVACWPGPRPHRLALCAAGLVWYCASALLLPGLLLRWRGVVAADVFGRAVADLGCSSRKVLWSNVLDLIAQRPWLGWGWGELDYAHYVTLYPGPRFCDILDNAHNLPLHLAVELGIPAALLLVGIFVGAVWKGRPWTEADAGRQLAWGVLLVIAIHSLLEYPLWYGPFQVAALLACLQLARGWRPSLAVARGAAGAAAVAVAALWGVWIDYDRVSDAYRPPEQRRSSLRQDPVAGLRGSWLFGDQVRFAELAVQPVLRANAPAVHALALEMLHYSPEPPVIEKVLDSALLLGEQDEALLHARRYEAAFPSQYAAWRAARSLPQPSGPPATGSGRAATNGVPPAATLFEVRPVVAGSPTIR